MSISKNSFSVFQRDIFLFFTQIITSVVIARKLGPEMMGIWVILQIIPSYAEAFGRLKFDIAAVYYLGRGRYKLNEMVSTLNILAIISSSIIIIIVILNFNYLYSLLFQKADINVSILVYLMLIQIPLRFIMMNYTYLFIYKEEISTYNRMIVIQALFASVTAILLLLVFNMGLNAVVFATVLSPLIALLYGIVKFKSDGKYCFRINLRLVKSLFKFALNLYFSGVIGQFFTYLTKFIVVLYLPTAEVAFFSMAQSNGTLIRKLPTALNVILFPKLSKIHNKVESSKLASRAFRVILILLILVGIVSIIFIKPLVILLYGYSFTPLILPFIIMIPGIVLGGAGTVFTQYFTALGRPDLTWKITIFPLIVQILSAFLLIPIYGTSGAAVSFLFSMLMFFVIQIFVFYSISGVSSKLLIFHKEDFYTIFIFIKTIFLKKFQIILKKK